jgi:hypothetical protein
LLLQQQQQKPNAELAQLQRELAEARVDYDTVVAERDNALNELENVNRAPWRFVGLVKLTRHRLCRKHIDESRTRGVDAHDRRSATRGERHQRIGTELGRARTVAILFVLLLLFCVFLRYD